MKLYRTQDCILRGLSLAALCLCLAGCTNISLSFDHDYNLRRFEQYQSIATSSFLAGQPENAEQAARRAVAYAKSLNPSDYHVGQAELLLAEILKSMGKLEESHAEFVKAAAVLEVARENLPRGFDSRSILFDLARAYVGSAENAFDQGSPTGGNSVLANARDVYADLAASSGKDVKENLLLLSEYLRYLWGESEFLKAQRRTAEASDSFLNTLLAADIVCLPNSQLAYLRERAVELLIEDGDEKNARAVCDSERWLGLMNSGTEQLAQGNQKEALDLFKEALSTTKSFQREDLRKYKTLKVLAELSAKMGNKDLSGAYWDIVLKGRELAELPYDQEFDGILTHLIDLHWDQKSLIYLGPLLDRRLKLQENLYGKNSAQCLETYAELAILYESAKRIPEAEDFAGRAKAIIETLNILPTRSLKAVSDLANFYLHRGALVAWTKTLDLLQRSLIAAGPNFKGVLALNSAELASALAEKDPARSAELLALANSGRLSWTPEFASVCRQRLSERANTLDEWGRARSAQMLRDFLKL